MTTELRFLIIFSLIAGANLIILFAVLFFRKNNTLINKALGVMILIAGTQLIANSITHAGGFYNHPFLFYLSCCNSFFFGPMLILYLHLMEGNSFEFKKIQLIHFLPVLLVVIYGSFVALQSKEDIHENYLDVMQGKDTVTNAIYLLQFFHFAIYIIWGIRKVKRFGKVVRDNLTSYEEVNYKWMWFFVTRLLFLNISLPIIYALQMHFFPSYFHYSELLATPIVASCFYPIIFFKSLSHHLIFDKEGFEQLVDRKKALIEVAVDAKKDRKEEPDNLEQLILIKKELDKRLQENKVFTTPKLSVQKLADEIGCGRTVLSQTINRLYDTTFYELINSYRVEEAKKLLVNPDYFHLKIDSIGEMAGFNSRTSFFSSFRNVTQLTPTEYRLQKAK